MHLNRFDLNLLVALDALLQEKNVTRAAQRVGFSQPAMSAALHKCREYFGDPLLTRAGRQMCLTPRGLALVEPVREALLGVRSILGMSLAFDAARLDREFSVIVRDHTVPQLLPGVMRLMLAEAPGVSCTVQDVSQTSLAQLEVGDSDLAVLIDNPRVFGLEAFPGWMCLAPLRTVQWVCVFCKDHPDIGDTLTMEQYESLPHVLAEPQGPGLSMPELLRRMASPNIDVRVTTQSPFLLPFIVPGTRLIATVPEPVARRLAALLPIRMLPTPTGLPASREVVVWHRRYDARPEQVWLRSLFLRSARDGERAYG